jgi:hypothetical protein
MRLLTISAGCALVGCRDVVPPTGAEAAPGSYAAFSVADERPDEAEMAAFARRIPGLAGYHFGPDGELVVSLTDPAQEEHARTVLAGVAARGRGQRVQVRPARYAYLQLRSWRDEWSGRILEVAGVSFVDLDEAANQVVVGIGQPEARARVLELLRGSDVPAPAVGFSEAGYASLRALVEYAPYIATWPTQGDSITSYRRPLEGGLKVTYRHSSDPTLATTCTAGFVAMLGGVRVLITASHCSLRHWDGDNTTYFQAQPGAGRYVGYEYRDPNGSSCGFMSPNVCRHSDASAIALESDVAASFGYIVRPVGPPPAGISPYGVRASSLLVDAANPRFLVTGVRGPVLNELVDKVGATTGWTRGAVSRTCVDMPAQRSWSKLRCQTWTKFSSADGDSGGPVFVPGPDGTATLLGMMWGGVTEEGEQYSTFSSVGQIQKDLGTLQVMPGGSSSGDGPGDGGEPTDPGGTCPPHCVT